MANEAVRVLRNTFYASVGFGVLAFQKAQVRRRELEAAGPAAGRGRSSTHLRVGAVRGHADRAPTRCASPFDATALLGAAHRAWAWSPPRCSTRLADRARPRRRRLRGHLAGPRRRWPRRAARGHPDRRPTDGRPTRCARRGRRADRPPIEWWTGPVDVVHGPNFVVPPAGGAAELVTVHDLTFVRFPELCTADTLAYPP